MGVTFRVWKESKPLTALLPPCLPSLGLHTKPVSNFLPPSSHSHESSQQLKYDSAHGPIPAGFESGSLMLSGRGKHCQGTTHHLCFKHVLQEEITHALETKHSGNPDQLKFKSHFYPSECQHLIWLLSPCRASARIIHPSTVITATALPRLPFTGSPSCSSTNLSSWSLVFRSLPPKKGKNPSGSRL